ncbi:Gfo/Idh/MocA family oxidoreductase [Ciceribacter sp. L1K23]|uniref:Gfo/Idh/MocA family protein n=1 Tax=Ciceribacter sp. L1K23 TaxID=2820276 RepID=UPI001B812AA5|nr:Gfo/Idh/MocA family oxidoreductase [Ciceribacter sp. L1K23]MBR0554074.1 Gfo/Idh/MocA family oxidoreductase [Ciceribacter sp. L1K23]
MKPVSLALVGVGKIARDQHIPSIAGNTAFKLDAAVSRHGRIEGVENFTDFDEFLKSRPDVTAVSLCTPPEVRFDMAAKAISAGRHVMLEKPPAATIGEAEALSEMARKSGVTLFATWHSRFATAVAPAKAWLSGKDITGIKIIWKEDVRRWHPGQAWIWEPAGFGVFDPGINALSILTALLSDPVIVEKARLEVPSNKRQPIGATLRMRSAAGVPISADFDWRQEGPQTWDIEVTTREGVLRLSKGGSEMYVDDKLTGTGPDREYAGIYARFAELLQNGESDVDFQPLRIVADAFLCGENVLTDEFFD